MIKDNFALRLYTRVARLGSFSAAARECGLSQPQASRIVADLEAELGVRLLTRTTRAVVPTEAGAEFLARIESILLALDDAEQSVREGGELRGLLRISTPTSFGIHDVIPNLASFAERHPQLHIEMQLGDKRQDLIKDAVDVAIRLGRLPDSTATARLIATIPRVIVASPGYLARHGMPETPDDLVRHHIVGGTAAAVPTAWRFERNGQESAIKLEPHFSTDENEGAIAATVAGFGITSTSGWACRRELADGSLVRLLANWTLAGIPVHAYFPMGRATRAAARAAIDHLAVEFRRRSNNGSM
ncbi:MULTISPECIES: LysR family transcriptional regulator [Rhizobium]|uniref:HTH-type transcriptional regulator TtuA n=1 Tax=Rhizobium miluonense TaxID=411945 RepID=A0A1C3VBE4_9HYPH|nr:LysR family transcriptional regulator [Rhizobium miluonense]SCB25126.1 DNA-binding transcriptional regulator, LysR family [Rhizobium miluonense]